MSKLLMFAPSDPGVYMLSTVYDPTVDGSDASNSGKFIPAVGSIIVDDTTLDGSRPLYSVVSVNETTYETTMVPATMVSGSKNTDKLVSYGNDVYMLYYDNRSRPTTLMVDGKISIFGMNAAEYRLTRSVIIDGNVTTEVISQDIETDGSVVGTRIPIVESPISGVRKCSNCYTTYSITDGDVISLEIFDSAGVQIMNIKLIAKRSIILNDVDVKNNPIVNFEVTCNQESGDNWYLYVGQDPEELAIFPILTYADGSTQMLTIDNQSCYIYGLDEISTDYAGKQYPVLVKYFVPAKVPVSETVQVSTTTNVNNGTETIVEETRYTNLDGFKTLTVRKMVSVIDAVRGNISKVSVIPSYNNETRRWELTFVAYYQNREFSKLLNTENIEYVDSSFDGTSASYGIKQKIAFNVYDIVDNVRELIHSQEIVIEINDPNSSMPFLLADTDDSEFIYGNNIYPHSRPYIGFKDTIDGSAGGYYIPSSKFTTEEEFLDNFYIQASPPFGSTETVAPTPTHFAIKSINNKTETVNYIKIQRVESDNNLGTGYDKIFMLRDDSDNIGSLVGSTVIVEFAVMNSTSGNLNYEVLYGVPVKIIRE